MAITRRRPDDADDEDGLLQDGHIGRVRMMLRDGMGDDTPGHRPGFVHLSDEAARARARVARASALADYEISLTSAWRGPISDVADEQVDTAVADAAAHADHTTPRPMSQVYEIYDAELENTWRRPLR
jgi:hypothetical protein